MLLPDYSPPHPTRHLTLTLQADALGALHSLCQLSRSRQEQAAEQKAPAALVALAQQQHPPHAAAAGEQHGAQAAATASSVSRGLVVSLLCGFGEWQATLLQQRWLSGDIPALQRAALSCHPGMTACGSPALPCPILLTCRLLRRSALQRMAGRAAGRRCGLPVALMPCWRCSKRRWVGGTLSWWVGQQMGDCVGKWVGGWLRD